MLCCRNAGRLIISAATFNLNNVFCLFIWNVVIRHVFFNLAQGYIAKPMRKTELVEHLNAYACKSRASLADLNLKSGALLSVDQAAIIAVANISAMSSVSATPCLSVLAPNLDSPFPEGHMSPMRILVAEDNLVCTNINIIVFQM